MRSPHIGPDAGLTTCCVTLTNTPSGRYSRGVRGTERWSHLQEVSQPLPWIRPQVAWFPSLHSWLCCSSRQYVAYVVRSDVFSGTLTSFIIKCGKMPPLRLYSLELVFMKKEGAPLGQVIPLYCSCSPAIFLFGLNSPLVLQCCVNKIGQSSWLLFNFSGPEQITGSFEQDFQAWWCDWKDSRTVPVFTFTSRELK